LRFVSKSENVTFCGFLRCCTRLLECWCGAEILSPVVESCPSSPLVYTSRDGRPVRVPRPVVAFRSAMAPRGAPGSSRAHGSPRGAAGSSRGAPGSSLAPGSPRGATGSSRSAPGSSRAPGSPRGAAGSPTAAGAPLVTRCSRWFVDGRTAAAAAERFDVGRHVVTCSARDPLIHAADRATADCVFTVLVQGPHSSRCLNTYIHTYFVRASHSKTKIA